jgi:hypothetical protein
VDREYQSWTSGQWLEWIDRRERLDTPARNRLKSPTSTWPTTPLNEKPINTVVIATPAEIADAFDESDGIRLLRV